MFLFQLLQFKQWLLRGATDAEQERITRTLAGMHWSAQVSYKDGRPVGVRWHDCGFEQASLCAVPEPTTRFAYTRPEDRRDPVPADIRFLQACGVRPDDVRDSLLVLDR
ncbi:MAG TPA: hypothetical protein VN948_14435 [Terriglobales bacterium]|nr:hypothetical protein [Terriglobales bacterium]